MGTQNSNTISSITGIEDVIRSYEQQKKDPKQAEIMEKLKALQLVEEMIKTQEHLLLSQPVSKPEPDQPPKASPRRALSARAGSSPRKSQSPPLAQAEIPLVSSTEHSISSSASAKPAADRKTQQLKLLNDKIAQKHTKNSEKANPNIVTSSGKRRSNTPVVTKSVASKPRLPGKGKDHPLKKPVIASSTKRPRSGSKPKSQNERVVIPHDCTLPLTSQEELPQNTLAPKPTPSNNEPSFGKDYTLKNTEPQQTDKPPEDLARDRALDAEDSDMLSSTSIYVPLEEALGGSTLDSQFEAALEGDSLDSTVLASPVNGTNGHTTTLLEPPSQAGGDSDLGTKSDTNIGIENGPDSRAYEFGMDPGLKESVAQNTIQLQG